MLALDKTLALNTVKNLAMIYCHQGKLEEAEKLYSRVLSECEVALGLEHLSTLTTLHNLGILHRDSGRLHVAEAMLESALDVMKRTLDPNHPTITTVSNNLEECRSQRKGATHLEKGLLHG